MELPIRKLAIATLIGLAVGAGIWCGLEFRRPSIALLGFVAFLAVAAPLAFALPVLATVESTKGVVLILSLPVVTFAATKLWFRASENSGESLIGLLILFACAFLMAGAIAYALAATRTDMRTNYSNADHGFGAFSLLTAAGLLTWLTFRGDLMPQALWVAIIFFALGILMLLSRAIVHRRKSGSEQRF